MSLLRICAALALTLCAGSVTNASPAVPVQAGQALQAADFALLPEIDRPKLSPDGRHIAALKAVNGKQYLMILPLDGSAPKVIGTGKVDLNWWRWVNDDWLIAGIGGKIPLEDEEFYISRAISIRADGMVIRTLGAKGTLGQNSADVLWAATDGTARVLLSVQRSIYGSDREFWPEVIEVDLAANRERSVLSPREGVFSWVADHQGVVRMGFGRSVDGRRGRILYRPDGATDFKTIDRTGRDEEQMDTPDLFLPDGSAVTVARDEKGFAAVYAFDLDKLEKGEKLFATPGYDVDGVIEDRMTGAVAGYSVEERRAYTHWVLPDMIALQQAVDAQVKGAHAEIVSTDRARQRAVVLITGPDAPGAYFLYDRQDGSMTLLGLINASIGMSRLNPVRTERYTSRDGVSMEAVLTLPKNKTGNLPLIVMPHGGPYARDSESWDWMAQFLASRGYAVIQPNYRGSSGYGLAYARLGEGQWGLKMQDDLIDAIAYLKQQGIADDKRVCIVGASYGGYAAIRAAQRDAAHYRCAVSYAGVSDLNAQARYNGHFLFGGARTDWLEKQAPDFRDVSPINAPEQIALPLLLVHGKEDDVVPYDQSHDLAIKLTRLGKPVTYIEQRDADHHFTRMEDRLEFLKAMQAFLDRYNPA